tara:strand:- start:13082 stop:13435 length:354 start_codon:yes stop_codon:yes gene_type:complete
MQNFVDYYRPALANIGEFVKLLKNDEKNENHLELIKIIKTVKKSFNKGNDKTKDLGYVQISEYTIKYMIKNKYDENNILIMQKINELLLLKYSNNKVDYNNDYDDNYGDIKISKNAN